MTHEELAVLDSKLVVFDVMMITIESVIIRDVLVMFYLGIL